MAHRTRTLARLLIDIALLAALIVPGAAAAEILAAPPDRPDPARIYLVYSHGQIVEGSDGRPVSAEFGPYEYAEILERLSREGFVVISGVRAANAELEEEARKLQVQVRALLDAGVPANHVVVVGVSKGGMIAIRAAHLLANREIRYVILSSFFAPYATRADYLPYGEILSIQDASDGLELRPERFLDDPAKIAELAALDAPLNAADAEEAGLVTFAPDEIDWDDEVRVAIEARAAFSPDAMTGLEANLRFAGPETMETKIFGRLTAWQNWIFQRPNAVGDKGALKVYGQQGRAEFDWKRT